MTAIPWLRSELQNSLQAALRALQFEPCALRGDDSGRTLHVDTAPLIGFGQSIEILFQLIRDQALSSYQSIFLVVGIYVRISWTEGA